MLKPIIASGQGQKFMYSARHLKTESEPELCQNNATFVKLVLGKSCWKPLIYLTQSLIMKLEGTWNTFSKATDDFTSWLPAFIFSIITRGKLSCKIGTLY